MSLFASISSLIISWLLAAIFVQAVVHKIRAWPRFEASLAAYDLLPGSMISFAAGILVVWELVTIAVLVVWTEVGLSLAAILLAIYALAMAINVVRGRTHIDCGCGDEPTPVSWVLVGRNVVLIVFAALSFWQSLDAVVLLPVAAIAFAGLIVAVVLYACADQLFANHGRYQRLWSGSR
jgi:hypothetical protein